MANHSVTVRKSKGYLVEEIMRTSTEGLSLGVTEYFVLLQVARIKAGKIPSGVRKTLYKIKKFSFVVAYTCIFNLFFSIKFSIIT